MFKTLLVTVALLGVTAYSYGQGTVNFNTRVLNSDGSGTLVVDRRATLHADLGGGSPTNTGYFAQLYAATGSGAAESSLVPVGAPVNFRGGNNTGYIAAGAVTVTPVAGGAATVQIRAWNSAFPTYEAAFLANSAVGKGQLINLTSTGGAGSPPGLPVDLLGTERFEIAVVPEPSTLALAALGLTALLFRRRK